ncbi:hypothetical protein GGS20DRAFT_535846 [Poronia punctata]|nr:hypothetical protein GGS20DRAFT_535846 [Poronia punctata]
MAIITKTQITISVAIGIICTIIAVATTWVNVNPEEPFNLSHIFSTTSGTNSSSSDNKTEYENEYTCSRQAYTTEIISLDPLVIYIHDFFSPPDINEILKVGSDKFKPSVVHKNGKMVQNPYRTSMSAVLSAKEPSVNCILERSKKFLGTILDPVEDEMGVPQLVQYTAGQEYNLHHDWMRIPQAAFDGSARTFNRVASFFVTLQDNCTGGETWFPQVNPVVGTTTTTTLDEEDEDEDETRLWRRHEDGGIAFKPVAGNAIFWVNLFANGTGDGRTVHAGLPVTDGLKTAMNIWPRQYRHNKAQGSTGRVKG